MKGRYNVLERNCFRSTQFKRGVEVKSFSDSYAVLCGHLRKSFNRKSLSNEVNFLYYTSNIFVKVCWRFHTVSPVIRCVKPKSLVPHRVSYFPSLAVLMEKTFSRFSTPSWWVGKAVRNYSVCMGNKPTNLFKKLNFTQFVNPNVKILRRRLNSPRFKDVAWLEDAQLIFLIFHTFVCIFGWVDAVRGKWKEIQTNVWEIKN